MYMTKILCTAIALLGALGSLHAQQPRLVVQIVVGSMRADDIDRYAANFGDGGFLRLQRGGAVFTGSRYDYQQTSTPVSLATLTTGAQPSTHGVIGLRWRDYVQNEVVDLVRSKEGISPRNLIAPTLGEALLAESPESRVVTVAAEPVSAVVMAGRAGQAFWMDPMYCNWTTSAWYDRVLPEWIQQFNRERFNLSYLGDEWSTLLDRGEYRNTRRFDIVPQPRTKEEKREKRTPELRFADDLDRMLHTPAGNAAVLGFAKLAVAQYKLGADEAPDLLNICLDAPRRIAEAYGPESVEVEDMYYRLDRDLADFLTYLDAQAGEGNVVVALASDHGTSPSYDAGAEECDRFNLRQFEVIVNSFLNVRYGVGKWLLEYEDKCVYLDHNLIYEKGLDLASVQNEVAIFAMQFRGVSHALSATAMRTSYFGSGYARKMQNSFYPRRSGDVILNFQPGWIEERERCRSSSGSMYGYDTEVPLIFYGTGIAPQCVGREVDMIAVAPTLASLLGVRKPAAAEGSPLPEVTGEG
ncbi:Alkaline phosphatase PafA precursor [Alistipes sp. CHKCI003]|nr:Alkaline phosphatase PafA precursor [Alistipes sp. CHKCI003]